MNSLRARMTVWFGLVFLAMAASFTFLIRHTLEQELENRSDPANFPNHPDWKMHGSYSAEEVQDIASALMVSAMVWSFPLIVTALVGGYWMAHHSLRPIAGVNRQLAGKKPENLAEPIRLAEADEEFRDLLQQLNGLLKRLDESFTEMNRYAAKVAHELRTPLAILRLKVEQAGERIAPELADELENELHRLTYVVEQSLLIARAELGRSTTGRTVLNFSNITRDLVEDFRLLSLEQGRNCVSRVEPDCWVNTNAHHIRQISHNLLSNALKHGDGDIAVRVRKRGGNIDLLVANQVKRRNSEIEADTLGLGLRVVDALLRLEPEIHYQRRRGNRYYAVRLNMPAKKSPQSPV
ncbi:MAG TPA: histidine kinase dimerization/phospho-acceptor domain-containing protein [Verrucomicrobiae bacterium]|nr:histidine kinase dimerization/phospho-acceptor domain-containing protein [Verrucomicrobiae bacterium]